MTQRHSFQNEITMFITTNIQNRRKIFLNEAYAREAIDALYRVQELYPFFLYAFVIMPNHVHFLIRALEPIQISSIIRSYKRAVSHAIGKGPIWQPRFHMRMPNDALAALRYIHRNPVKAGLVESPEDYPWSSASGKWDVSDLVFY